MEVKTVGTDIGKTWFHLVAYNQAGKPITRHKLNRTKLSQFMSNLPICVVAMEACPGSQHLARSFQKFGHQVRLIAPKFIKPYVRGQKDDFNDAAAIAEAATRQRCGLSPSSLTNNSTCRPYIESAMGLLASELQ